MAFELLLLLRYAGLGRVRKTEFLGKRIKIYVGSSYVNTLMAYMWFSPLKPHACLMPPLTSSDDVINCMKNTWIILLPHHSHVANNSSEYICMSFFRMTSSPYPWSFFFPLLLLPSHPTFRRDKRRKTFQDTQNQHEAKFVVLLPTAFVVYLLTTQHSFFFVCWHLSYRCLFRNSFFFITSFLRLAFFFVWISKRMKCQHHAKIMNQIRREYNVCCVFSLVIITNI